MKSLENLFRRLNSERSCTRPMILLRVFLKGSVKPFGCSFSEKTIEVLHSGEHDHVFHFREPNRVFHFGKPIGRPFQKNSIGCSISEDLVPPRDITDKFSKALQIRVLQYESKCFSLRRKIIVELDPASGKMYNMQLSTQEKYNDVLFDVSGTWSHVTSY